MSEQEIETFQCMKCGLQFPCSELCVIFVQNTFQRPTVVEFCPECQKHVIESINDGLLK